MFKEEYKKAYDEIKAENCSVNEIFAHAQEKNKRKKAGIQRRRVAVALLTVVMLFAGASISTMAKELREGKNLYESGIIDYTSYKSLQRNSYNLEIVIPENASVSKDGVIVTLEAVIFDKKEFALFYSLANEEGYDLIKEDGGYDWSNVKVSFDGEPLEINNTRIWKEDEENGKVYYKFTSYRDTARYPVGETISLKIEGAFKKDWDEEIVDLSNIVLDADTKTVKLVSSSVNEDLVKLENEEYPYMASVLDITPMSEIQPDKGAVTGIGYIDGVLRVQFCQPDNSVYEESYQRTFVSVFDKEGKSIHCDESIFWYEKVDGELVEFIEMYYLLSETKLKELSMKMESMYLKGNFDTTWDVEFVVPN